MLFTEIVRAIHPHLMKDADIPDFMRNLIQMLCDIPEEEWSTQKDPSSKVSVKDTSLRKYYSQGLTKKLAKRMLGRLTKDEFIDAVEYDRTDTVLESLADDIHPWKDDVNANNVAETLFELLKESLELIINPELDNDRIILKSENESRTAKASCGSALLEDCQHICSHQGCNKHLQTLLNGDKMIANYEVAKIDENKKADYNNLIALCHDCFRNFVLNRINKQSNEFKKIKENHAIRRSNHYILDEISIEAGLTQVIDNLVRVKNTDLSELNYNAVKIDDKIDSDEFPVLVFDIRSYVTRYYRFIESTLQKFTKTNTFSDDYVRSQIKEAYRRLALNNNNKETIFLALANQLSKITKQDVRYCSIVIAYFVQSCEVFDANSK